MNKIKLSLLTAAFWASVQVPVQAEPNCPQDAVDLCHQLIGFLNKEEAAGKLKPAGILWDGEHLDVDENNPLRHEWVAHAMFMGVDVLNQDLSALAGSGFDKLMFQFQRMKAMAPGASFTMVFSGESFEETALAQAYKDYQAPVSSSVVPAQPKGPRAEDPKKDGPAGGNKAPLRTTNPAQITETGDIAIQKTAAQLADKSRGRANLVVPVIKIPVKPDPAMKLPLNTPVAPDPAMKVPLNTPVAPDPAMKVPLNTPVKPDPAMKVPLNTPVTPGSSPMTPYPEPGQPPAITASKPTDPPPVKDTVVTPVAGSNSGTSITPPRTPSVGPQMAATATPGPRTSKPDASGKVGPRAGDLIQKAPPGVPRNDLGGAPGMTPPVPNPSNVAPPVVTPYKAPPPVTITGTAVPTDNGGYTITFDPDQFITPYPEPGQPPAITASKPTDPPPVKDTVVTPVAGSNSGTSITPPRTPSVGPQMAATATPGPRTSKPDASGKVGPRAGDLIQKAPPGVPRNDLGGAPGMTPPVPNPSNVAPPIVTPYKAPPPVTITGTAVPTDNGGYTITFDPDQFITPYPEPGQPPAITASKPTDPPPVKDTVVTPVAGSNSGTSITPPRTPSVGPQMAATATPGPRTSKPDASGKVGPRAGDLIQKAPPGVPRNDLGGAPGMTPPVPNPSNVAPPIVTPYKAPPPVTITGTAVPTGNGGYTITFDPNQLAGLTTKGNKQDKTVGGAKPGPLALSPMQTLQQASKFGKGAGANSKQRTPQSAIQIAGLVSSSAVSAVSVSGNVGSGANQGSAQAKVEARPHAISLQHASSNCGGQRVGTAEINDCFVTARAGNQLDHNERAYSFDSEGKVWSCKLSGLGSRVMKDQDGQLTHEGHLETIHFASRSLSHIPSGQLSTNRCLIAVHK